MRLTVLGGQGAYPTSGHGCSGYLLDHNGFRLLIDPGYATVPVLTDIVANGAVDAVFVTHSHGDHCADLNPLLRVRHLNDIGPLAVYSLPGAVDAVLGLDTSMGLADQVQLHQFHPGEQFPIGLFSLRTAALLHFVDNVGVRIEADGTSLAYTGDGGGDANTVDLAADATALLSEATYLTEVPKDSAGHLSSARQAGEHATRAKVGRLILTHLWPGTDPGESARIASQTYTGPIDVAQPGLTIPLS